MARFSANSSKSSGKQIYDNVNNFTINTDEMLLIEGGGIQTITFSVSRDYVEKNLENLIMVRDSTGKFSAYLASYAFDDADIEIIRNEGIPADTQQKLTVNSLESFVSPFGKDGNNDVKMCRYVDHITEVDGIITVTFIYRPCDNEGGVSGGSSGGSSGGAGSPGGNGIPNGSGNPSGGGNDSPPSSGTPNPGNLPGQQGGGGGNSGGTVVTSPVTITPAKALAARQKAFSQKLRTVNLSVGFNELPANAQGEIWAFLESSLTNGEFTFIASEYPAVAVEHALEMITAGINGSAISFSPFFKYPVGSNYEVLYPNLTEYLKEKIPLLKDNYTIINAIKTYTPLTTTQIKKHLSWGSGPIIRIVQLDNFCTECDSNTHGVFQPSSDPNSIYIDIDLVNQLESSGGNPLADSFAFFIGVTVLHEYVHFGDNIDGIDYPGEEGELFEIDVYGQIVTRENAHIILSGS